MSSHADVLATSALVLVAIVVVTWIVSLVMTDASIVDIVWGAGFVVVAVVSALVGDGSDERSALLVTIVTIWGMRLSVHLWWRNRGAGEDPRYQAMRRKAGDSFPARSLVTVFLFQGALMWVISLPVQLAMTPGEPEEVGILAVIGVVVWGIGLFFESVGDAQLARFRADPDNAEEVMDKGLWRYTRHPNYFGDCCVWWGIFLVAAETSDARFGVIGPIVMTILLLRVSGVALLERSITKRRPGYEDYIARTSSFFPRPPKPVH